MKGIKSEIENVLKNVPLLVFYLLLLSVGFFYAQNIKQVDVTSQNLFLITCFYAGMFLGGSAIVIALWFKLVIGSKEKIEEIISQNLITIAIFSWFLYVVIAIFGNKFELVSFGKAIFGDNEGTHFTNIFWLLITALGIIEVTLFVLKKIKKKIINRK